MRIEGKFDSSWLRQPATEVLRKRIRDTRTELARRLQANALDAHGNQASLHGIACRYDQLGLLLEAIEKPKDEHDDE